MCNFEYQETNGLKGDNITKHFIIVTDSRSSGNVKFYWHWFGMH